MPIFIKNLSKKIYLTGKYMNVLHVYYLDKEILLNPYDVKLF